MLESGSATLTTLAAALDRPVALDELAPGEWLLSANLRIEEDASLTIAAPDAQYLKLHSDDERFVWIKAYGGQLSFSDVCVTSWDPTRNTVDREHADGRSFVLVRGGGTLLVRDAELSYLGYDAHESYGVAVRLAGSSAEISGSRLDNNYYGFYSYEASGLVIRNNEVSNSVLYGIDPHTESHQLTIENNIARHNGKHGIILAERCRDSVVRGNIAYANQLHGIVLYQGSDNNLVEANIAYANGRQGININDASDNIVRDNLVFHNADAGIGVGQDARDNLIADNRVHANQGDGITIYSDASDTVLRNNTVDANARYGIYVKSEDNQIEAGNLVVGNQVGIYWNVDQPPRIDDSNQVYANSDDNLRLSKE